MLNFHFVTMNAGDKKNITKIAMNSGHHIFETWP